MINNRLMKILLAQVVTEKTTVLTDASNQYAFKVLATSTKPEIKQAVEKLFEVSVTSVRVTNVKPKEVRTRQVKGKQKGWKKAYVSLANGHRINLSETAA